jgi:hypothetical protein
MGVGGCQCFFAGGIGRAEAAPLPLPAPLLVFPFKPGRLIMMQDPS